MCSMFPGKEEDTFHILSSSTIEHAKLGVEIAGRRKVGEHGEDIFLSFLFSIVSRPLDALSSKKLFGRFEFLLELCFVLYRGF